MKCYYYYVISRMSLNVGENSGIAQGVADGHITVQRHEHEHPGLHPRQHVDKKHLGQAGIKMDLLEVEPEYAQHIGYSGSAQGDICEGEQGQEVVHGSVQGLLIANEVDESTVPQDSNDVHEAEWQGDPDMCGFQPRNTIQNKESWGQTGTVGSSHNG